jgi:hypothetical protein
MQSPRTEAQSRDEREFHARGHRARDVDTFSPALSLSQSLPVLSI